MDIHALQGAGANNMMSKAKKRQKKVIPIALSKIDPPVLR